MLSVKDYLKKIAVAVFIGYCFWVFLLVSKSILYNYPPVNSVFLSNGKIAGGDFIAFYTAGKIARTDKTKLYDFHYQAAKRDDILGKTFKVHLPFIYPPLMAWAFSGFAVFDFVTAFYLFTFLSALMAVVSLILLHRRLRSLNALSLCVLLLGIFGFMPFYNGCLSGGQLASIGILVYAMVFFFLKKDKDFTAGLVLSLGYYKPPLFLLFAIALTLTRGRQFFFGCLCGTIVLAALSTLYIGPSQFWIYITDASRYTYGQELFTGFQLPVEYGMGIFALLTSLMPSMTWTALVYAALFLGALFMSIACLKRVDPSSELYNLSYAANVIASLALSLQLGTYDLSPLLVPFLIILLNRSVPVRFRWALVAGIALFYGEWQIMKITIHGYIFHLAPLLFAGSFIMLCLSIFKYPRKSSPVTIFQGRPD